ncbi:MAG TPA: imidazole glycerol phosphate synthase subunit HisH [Candidatus Acidoferrum sp.]|nr:imidazole glycerol phosphate synthase subunit HisH [Candidatus Acidoferrum sp.]
MKITLLDYGAGNVTSVDRALRRLGAEPLRSNSAECIANAEAIILPGVGHYSALIRALDQKNLRYALVDALHRGVPFLGICLGLQALYKSSEEAPELLGLNLLPGRVCSLPSTLKLPHMGWNQLKVTRPSRLLGGVPPDSFFYFAHSFAATQPNGEAVAVCKYGMDFVAVIEQKNIYAVQFHPEKSGDPGARLLQTFLAGCR